MTEVRSSAVWGRELLEAGLDPSQSSKLPEIANKTEAAALAATDAEIRYLVGRLLAYCGQEGRAVRLLKITMRHYCAKYSVGNRSAACKGGKHSRIREIRSAAKECQNEGLAEKGRLAVTFADIGIISSLPPPAASP